MWRKALRVCKSMGKAAVILLFPLVTLSAQELSMPTMPTISAPTIGGGIYSPYSSTNPAFSNMKNGSAASGKQTSSGSAKETSASSENQLPKKASSSLTASDIATMGDLGLLDQLRFLQNVQSTSNNNVTATVSSQTTNNLLQQILGEMEEIKNKNKTVTDEAEKKSTSDTPAASIVTPGLASQKMSSDKAGAHSRLLRFNVNGYDVLKTCRTVYISDMHSDGTFLVTGDRKYMSDGKVRNETFHLLFTADNANNSNAKYRAAAEVNQDYFNQYSFLYELSKRNDLSAFRTGNLVTMRTSDPQWKLDMLIDLGDQK